MLTSFLGTTLGSTLGTALNMGFGQGGGSPGFNIGGFVEGLWTGTMNGITNAAVSLGINYAVEELDLPPILGQLGGQVLGSIANLLVNNATQLFGKMLAVFNSKALTTGNKPDKNDSKYWSINSTTGENELNIDLFADDMATWSWNENGYKLMAKSLDEHIANNGFENSMNMFAGSIFEQHAY